MISRHIESYREAHAGNEDLFFSAWPQTCGLYGWHIKLLKDGYQESHIHPSGWLSGVIYLKMPADISGDEGGITFTLHGHNYPVLKNDVPSLHHAPRVGDLVLFPSSLFHYTIPFHSDSERQVVAFDVCPGDGPGQ